jgi:DNA-binding XRE family transcriptional regulator
MNCTEHNRPTSAVLASIRAGLGLNVDEMAQVAHVSTAEWVAIEQGKLQMSEDLWYVLTLKLVGGDIEAREAREAIVGQAPTVMLPIEGAGPLEGQHIATITTENFVSVRPGRYSGRILAKRLTYEPITAMIVPKEIEIDLRINQSLATALAPGGRLARTG